MGEDVTCFHSKELETAFFVARAIVTQETKIPPPHWWCRDFGARHLFRHWFFRNHSLGNSGVLGNTLVQRETQAQILSESAASTQQTNRDRWYCPCRRRLLSSPVTSSAPARPPRRHGFVCPELIGKVQKWLLQLVFECEFHKRRRCYAFSGR